MNERTDYVCRLCESGRVERLLSQAEGLRYQAQFSGGRQGEVAAEKSRVVGLVLPQAKLCPDAVSDVKRLEKTLCMVDRKAREKVAERRDKRAKEEGSK